jgi:hypothetical protein
MAALLPKNWDVPQIFRDRLGSQAGRQRTMVAEGHVLLILHEVPDPGTPDERKAHFFWRSPAGEWRSTGTAGRGVGPLRAHVEAYASAVDALEARVERASTADDYFAVLHVVTPLRRSARNMHQALQDARDALKDDKDVIALRDRAGDVERAAELINSYAHDGLEFTVARRAEDNARFAQQANLSAHRLNVLAALCLPVTAVGSVLGMNLEHGWEHASAPSLFWAVTVASFLLGFLVKAAVVRPSGHGGSAT